MPDMAVELPTDNHALATLIREHVNSCEADMGWRWARCYMMTAYLQGYREFDAWAGNGERVWNYHMGDNRDTETTTKFRLGELLQQMNDVVGVLDAADMMPRIDQTGFSLAGLQRQGQARAIMNSSVKRDALNVVQHQSNWFRAAFGTAGVQAYVKVNEGGQINVDYEAVHPRELVGFPKIGWNYGDLIGFVRTKMVSLEALRQLHKGKVPRKDLSGIEAFVRKPTDRSVQDTQGVNPWMPWSDASGHSNAAKGNVATTTKVRLHETYILNANGEIETFVASSGSTVFERKVYEEGQIKPFSPLQVGRFYDNGAFHGGGLVDTLFGMCREYESMFEDFVRSVAELDAMRIGIFPGGMVKNGMLDFHNGRKLKYLQFTPDPMMMQTGRVFPPFFLDPPTVVERGGEITSQLAAAIDRQSPVVDLVREKGRIDSAVGMQKLQEAEQESLSYPLEQGALMFGMLHKGVLDEIVSQGELRGMLDVPLEELSLELLGSSIDLERSSVTIRNFPDIRRLRIGVVEGTIQSALLKKAEALEMWQRYGDFELFKKTVIRLNIPVAIDIEAERAAYQTAVLQALMVYGDGQTSGGIEVNPDLDQPEILLEVWDEVMKSPAMRLASPEVKNYGIQYRRYLMQQLGVVLPPQMPDPQGAMNGLGAENGLGGPAGIPAGGGAGVGGPPNGPPIQ